MAEKFAVNDYVIYGKSGLCIVKEIKKMRMANGPLSEYYILNAASGNAVTIYVPCDKENLVSKMRRPMTKDEIDAGLITIWKELTVLKKSLTVTTIATGCCSQAVFI